MGFGAADLSELSVINLIVTGDLSDRQLCKLAEVEAEVSGRTMKEHFVNE